MSKLEFPYSKPPAPGEHIALSDGLHWIRHDLPFVLNHVNCWYLQSASQSTVVDTGVNSPATISAWQTQINKLGLPDKLLVTHFHPDHSGLAGWFAAQGVEVLSNNIEFEIIHRLWASSDKDSGEYYAQWYQQHGIEAQAIENALRRGNSYKKMLAQPPQACQYLAGGDVAELGGKAYEIKLGRGHAPAMLMLYDAQAGVLIAADQVLPTISPNVSLMPNTHDTDPLSSFIDTLNELRLLPSNTLVLPSHGLPFYGLHERIDVLLAHHQQRCDEILKVCQTPHSASELFGVLFKRELDAQQLSFALGESLAHAKYLCNLGTLTEVSDGSVVQFQTTQA